MPFSVQAINGFRKRLQASFTAVWQLGSLWTFQDEFAILLNGLQDDEQGMNVNVSGRDLSQAAFVDQVHAVLGKHGVAANRLTLEITESVLMSHLEFARDSPSRLRSTGVKIAIDDFGTGYSSLAYLTTLPVDCLKIDRSFVIAMDRAIENVDIDRAVLMLGQAMGKKVVAEGIETEEQLNTLRMLAVHVGQGYLLGRPIPQHTCLNSFHLLVKIQSCKFQVSLRDR